MTGSKVTVTESQLAPVTAEDVLALAGAAQAADGVAPLSEDALFNVRQEPAGVQGLVVIRPDGTLAGYAQLGRPEADPHSGTRAEDRSGELVIHPGHRRQGLGSALAAALTDGNGGYGIRLWAHGDLPAAAALARSAGFARIRSLWQMRMTLTDAVLPPVTLPAGLTLRTFRPGQDAEAWLEVNRRAFAHHPEQGSWTREDLALREAESWFDPDGFFLAVRDGRLAGFHWTKVHADGGTGGAPIGEVYVVGVDPGQQGGGLGRGLTIAGLAHLQRAGLAEVMLYVDEDNAAAVRMYAALGFSRWSTDVMYRHPEPTALALPPGPRISLAVAARRVIDAQGFVEFPLGERAVTRRDHGEDLGVELNLTECYVIVNTKIDLHGNRAHLRCLGTPCSALQVMSRHRSSA